MRDSKSMGKALYIQNRISVSKALTNAAVVMIYFQIYWHYWFVKMLGGYVVNTLLPITILFGVYAVRELMVTCSPGRVKRVAFHLLVPLLGCVLFASSSIILNEQGFGDIKAYLIYIYSPFVIFKMYFGLK